jgi:hypothetical protein
VKTSGGDGTLSVVTAPLGAVVGDTDVMTVSGKRVTKRVTALSSASTNPTFQCAWDTSDQCRVTSTGAAGTLSMSTPSGTPVDGDMLLIRFMCTNLQNFSWSAAFIASNNIPLPSTCPANVAAEFHVGVLYIGSLTKYQVIASD